MTFRGSPVKALRIGTGPILALLIALSLAGCFLESPDGSGIEGHAARPTVSTPSTTGKALAARPGVSDTTILFGQSAAFSGPAQELGRNMRLGIEAAFHEVNQRGGVHGRRLLLSYKDDGYEPQAAIDNTKDLIRKGNIFALIGAVGTPTSRSAAPVAADAGVPYIAPFTGAGLLREAGFLEKEQLEKIINLRASYKQETEEMVARLTTDLGIKRIAVMYQDDSYGRAGYVGVIEALKRRGMEPVSIGWYPRNTTAVKTGLLDLSGGSPEAVIVIGAYQPVASLVSWARYTGMKPVFMTVSFVGSNALAEQLGPGGAGVVVTQVVPFPTGDALPVVSKYRRALAEYEPGAEPGFVSLEGYLAGRLAIFGLEKCGGGVDRKCFLEVLQNSADFDIDGFPLGYGEDDNQGSDAVFLTIIGEDGGYRTVESLRDFPR